MPVYPIMALKAAGFAQVSFERRAIQAQVAPYNTDPQAALNAQVGRRLSPEQLRVLQANGFVIVTERASQIYDLYKQAQDAGIPPFVTTDALLHTYHILYDYILRSVEYDHLANDLAALLEAMVRASEKQLQDATKLPPIREAAQRNLAFFAVAQRLLDPQASIPDEVAPMVAQELALIAAHQGFSPSPIFGYEEDYSQYVPRGHYTRNETLSRYFQAMMWLGRMMFRLRPGATAEAIEAGRRETRQALLMVAALHSATVGAESAATVWERIYEPTVFFVGQTDDLNLYDYNELLRSISGNSLDLGKLADNTWLDAFIQKALALRPPKILSSLVTDQEKPEEVTKGFRFMGQRFVPDAYILQQLVYDKVQEYQGKGQPFTAVGPLRALPRGLDIASVLGSERAAEILAAEGDADYKGYPEQVAKLRKEFAALPAEQWTANLYWSWLHTLRPLLAPKGQGYPLFMQRAAWLDKNLNTFLGSWTELRHDTILYAKQSYTVKATGILPSQPKPAGYVEPEVEVWERLLYLVRQTEEGLGKRNLLGAEFEQRLANLEELVVALRDISLQELSGQPLNPQQAGLLESIGRRLEELTTFSEEVQGKLASKADTRMAVVADVHTDVNSGLVLQEGVGDPLAIYVLVPQGEATVITMGGVFAHYEFKQPMAQRLTDEAWQAMDPKPPFAPWFAALVQTR